MSNSGILESQSISCGGVDKHIPYAEHFMELYWCPSKDKKSASEMLGFYIPWVLRDSSMRCLSGFFQSNCTFWTPLDTTRPNFVNQQSLWQCWSRIISLTWSRIISLTDSLLWISGLLDFAVMLTKICAKYRNIDPSLIESRKNFVNLEFKLGILILSLLPSPQIYNKCKNCYCFKTMVWDGAKKGETTAEWGIETEYKMFLTYSPIFSTIHNIFNTWETKGEY
jgi:hypothetical protein